MPFENRPEKREPSDAMGDKEFLEIYQILESKRISDKRIARFVKRYTEGGMGAVRVNRAQEKEKQEFYDAEVQERKELEKRVRDLTDEELAMYSEKYYGHLERNRRSGDAIVWINRFEGELWRRKEEKKEIERLKSAILEG